MYRRYAVIMSTLSIILLKVEISFRFSFAFIGSKHQNITILLLQRNHRKIQRSDDF